MSDNGWRNVSIVLAFLCVALLGVAAALFFTSNSPSASPTPPVSDATDIAGNPSGTTVATATASASASSKATSTASAKATTTATPSPTPKPTPNAPIANVTFGNMQLDAKADGNAKARTFVFVSDGPGPVSGKVTAKSPQGNLTLCAQVDQEAANCWTGPTPSFTGMADQEHDTWTVTLLGTDILTPTVDVAFSWPANKADIKLTHGRFQGLGADSPLNGVTATFKARAAGQVQALASWTEILTNAVVACADVTNTPAVNCGEKQYGGQAGTNTLNPAAAFNVVANHTYKVSLRDLAADAQRPDLSFELRFP